MAPAGGALNSIVRRHDMFPPPTTLCGAAPIKAAQGTVPLVSDSVEILLPNGEAGRLAELNWSLSDFEIEDPDLAEAVRQGSMRTYWLTLGAQQLHLEQSNSVFWTSSPVTATANAPPRRTSGGVKPTWRRRSNRFWPHVDGYPVPFLAQAHIGGGDVYLFQHDGSSILLHRVDSFEQDVEDHYDDEERRDSAV